MPMKRKNQKNETLNAKSKTNLKISKQRKEERKSKCSTEENRQLLYKFTSQKICDCFEDLCVVIWGEERRGRIRRS